MQTSPRPASSAACMCSLLSPPLRPSTTMNSLSPRHSKPKCLPPSKCTRDMILSTLMPGIVSLATLAHFLSFPRTCRSQRGNSKHSAHGRERTATSHTTSIRITSTFTCGAFAARLVLNSSRHSIQMELPIVFSKTAKTTKTRRTPSLLLCSGAIDRGVRQNRRAPLAQLASLHKLENRRPPNMNLLDQSASASHLVQIHCLSQRQVLRGAQSAMRRIRRRGLRRDQTFIHSSGGFTWAKQVNSVSTKHIAGTVAQLMSLGLVQ
mmetsp:Transcript_1029/g.3441  ORF Transcript_1029/g.3441 Transcript_1029/m.3441 type:complete len:264 (-) Transcript_1029:515-1306(-)